MTTLPTAAQAFAQIDVQIEALSEPRHRQMLTAFRRHWHGEVTNDLDAAMSVVRDDVEFSVMGALAAGEAFTVNSAREHRAIYQIMPDMGLSAGGCFSDMRFAFSDWGVVMEAIYTNVVYGSMLANVGTFDPHALFLFQAPLAMICAFDDAGMMTSKRDYFAKVTKVEPANLDILRTITAS